MALSTTTKVWFRGIATAFISAFSTAAVGALTMPETFNFTKTGWANIAKITLAPAIVSVFAYLKQSPLPPASTIQPGDKLSVKDPKIESGTITGSEATLQKAPNPSTPAPKQ